MFGLPLGGYVDGEQLAGVGFGLELVVLQAVAGRSGKQRAQIRAAERRAGYLRSRERHRLQELPFAVITGDP